MWSFPNHFNHKPYIICLLKIVDYIDKVFICNKRCFVFAAQYLCGDFNCRQKLMRYFSLFSNQTWPSILRYKSIIELNQYLLTFICTYKIFKNRSSSVCPLSLIDQVLNYWTFHQSFAKIMMICQAIIRLNNHHDFLQKSKFQAPTKFNLAKYI